VLVCDVTDQGDSSGELTIELPDTDVPGGRGLWLAHRLTESLMLTRRPDGVTASVSVCLTPTAATPAANPAAAASAGDPTAEPATGGDQP
jgi:serine/threonine-protein kinase RsbW